MFDNNCCQFVRRKGPVNNVSHPCPNTISDPQTTSCGPDFNHPLSNKHLANLSIWYVIWQNIIYTRIIAQTKSIYRNQAKVGSTHTLSEGLFDSNVVMIEVKSSLYQMYSKNLTIMYLWDK